jgi:hypothetical protein
MVPGLSIAVQFKQNDSLIRKYLEVEVEMKAGKVGRASTFFQLLVPFYRKTVIKHASLKFSPKGKAKGASADGNHVFDDSGWQNSNAIIRRLSRV